MRNTTTRFHPYTKEQIFTARMHRAVFTLLTLVYLSNTAANTDTLESIKLLGRRYVISDGKLSLAGQGFRTFPEEVTTLANLMELDLSNNNIREVPAKIKQLKNLKILDLSLNHRLASLPEETKRLPKLERLNLWECNTPATTADSTLGKVDLLKIFDDRVVFHNSYRHDDRNSEYSVFTRSSNQPVCWNWSQLNRIRLAKNGKPEELLLKTQMIDIVERADAFSIEIYTVHKAKEQIHEVKLVSRGQSRSQGRGYPFSLNKFTGLPEILREPARHRRAKSVRIIDDAAQLIDYIDKIYTAEECTEYAMFGGHVPITLSLINNVLMCLDLFINSSKIGSLLYIMDDIREIMSSIGRLGLRKKHSNREDTDKRLDAFIRDRLAVMKDEIFRIAVSHGISTQHIPTYDSWRQRFADITRFDFDYEADNPLIFPPNFSDRGQSERTGAMQIFFDFFDPAYVMKLLTAEINKNDEVKGWLINRITMDKELPNRSGMVFDSLTSKTLGLVERVITPKAVEYLLLKMGILAENKGIRRKLYFY